MSRTWVQQDDDICNMEGVNTNWGGVTQNLPHPHLILSPLGNWALLAAVILFAVYAKIIDWNGASWQVVPTGNVLDWCSTFPMWMPNFHPRDSNWPSVGTTTRIYTGASWSSRAMVLDGNTRWTSRYSSLSSINFHWRPEIVFADSCDQLAVRATVNKEDGWPAVSSV